MNLKLNMALPLFMVFVGLISTPSFGQVVEGSTTEIDAKRLATPPIVATPRKASSLSKTRLEMVSKKANEITDDAAWITRTGVTLPDYRFGAASPEDYGDLPRGAALTYKGVRLQRALNTANSGTNFFLAIYGNEYSDERYLVCMNGFNGEYIYALDFSNYRSPANSEKAAALLPIEFAYEDKDGTLYVSNAINGYAKEAKGKTGYVTALEPKTGKLLWRSGPLTQNAHTFADAGDVLVCGYGFTAEPDFLHVIDKRSGRTVQTIPVKSGPSMIIRKGNRIYARCYDTDYVFDIKK